VLGTIYRISDKLDLATAEDVAIAEVSLKTQFPVGYREYVTTLGNGSLDSLVNVLMPARIVSDLAGERERWAGDAPDFFDLTPLPLPRLLESILLFTTFNGDDIVFHPDDSTTMYVLPRSEEQIYTLRGSLLDALEWACTASMLMMREHTYVLGASGHFVERSFYTFESFVDRRQMSFDGPPTTTFNDVQRIFTSFAKENMDTTTCVLRQDTDGDHHLQLLVKDCFADVHTLVSSHHDAKGVPIVVNCDTARPLARLSPLLASFKSLGYRRID